MSATFLLTCTFFYMSTLTVGQVSAVKATVDSSDVTRGLIGHWKLQGDCQDYSGHGNHGMNHGVDLASGTFDGIDDFVEVPTSESLKLGTGDFTICARIFAKEINDDVIGDILSMYDPALRRGITLSVHLGSGGYPGQGTERHISFGIDNAKQSEWQDCGRPNPTSNYVSNSLTVYKGKLYAATTDAQDEANWCHVYRYDGDQRWIDCGRVGNGRTTGVGPLIVHEGNLYAVTNTYDWTRVGSGDYDPGRVYRYEGGTKWHDCGQPSDNRTLTTAGSFLGKLFVGGGPNTWGVFVYGGDDQWSPSKLFPRQGPRKCFPHAMGRYNGKLYVGFPSVYAFDGNEWSYAGVPVEPENKLQTHSLTVYQGKLCAGTWPLAKVARYVGGEEWQEFGRVGEDGTEVNSLMVYNGKLYGGSIPRAEVCRYDGNDQWTSLKRFYSPSGWQPAPPIENGGNPTGEELNEWARVTSMTIFDGKLFASIGSCTSSVLDAPCDVRGKVFCMEAGKCISYDKGLGSGWRHITAIREGDRLKLYIDGQLVAGSSPFQPHDYDLSVDHTLRIGVGESDHFAGKISDLQLYNRALTEAEIRSIAETDDAVQAD